jgi:hypothetical protein
MTAQGMLARLINGVLAVVTFLALRYVGADEALAVVASLGVWCAPVPA